MLNDDAWHNGDASFVQQESGQIGHSPLFMVHPHHLHQTNPLVAGEIHLNSITPPSSEGENLSTGPFEDIIVP